MHPELKGVHLGHQLEKSAHGCRRIGNQIVVRQSPHRPCNRLVHGHHSTTTTSADLGPEGGGETQTPIVGHLHDSVERVEVALLRLPGQAHNSDLGEPFDVEQERIGRLEIGGRIVAKQQHKAVEPALGQEIEVFAPVILGEKVPLELGLVEDELRDSSLNHGRFLCRVAHPAQHIARLRGPP